MKNKIVVCVSNRHELYSKNFLENGIHIGKAYRCVGVLKLTAEQYYQPQFASLDGITIVAGVGRWGWDKPCFPAECFRLATKWEVISYRIILSLKMPFYLSKIYFFKIYNSIDRLLRRKYYRKVMDSYL